MTYLQLINRVLRGLREQQVSDLTADYTLLIGQLVNEAKEEVENAWKWKALRTDITFSTVSGTQDYNLGTGGVGSGGTTTQRSELLYDERRSPMLYVTQSGYERRMSEVGRELHKDWIIGADMDNTIPSTFSIVRSSTGITVSIYPKPNGAYTMAGRFYIPQDELDTATDVLSVPAEPVWRRALALAASERGAGMGEDVAKLEARADRVLWDAITREAEDGELTFYEE